jgi:hypothetical protein
LQPPRSAGPGGFLTQGEDRPGSKRLPQPVGNEEFRDLCRRLAVAVCREGLPVTGGKSGRRLVAAVEIISPANKDRAEHRQAFVSKCLGLLQELVSLVLVDVVTTRGANLYAELLEALGQSDPLLGRDSPAPYAAACRPTRPEKKWLLETWAYPLAIGRPLPQVPLWVADDLAVPLELEESYQESCALLGAP